MSRQSILINAILGHRKFFHGLVGAKFGAHISHTAEYDHIRWMFSSARASLLDSRRILRCCSSFLRKTEYVRLILVSTLVSDSETRTI